MTLSMPTESAFAKTEDDQSSLDDQTLSDRELADESGADVGELTERARISVARDRIADQRDEIAAERDRLVNDQHSTSQKVS